MIYCHPREHRRRKQQLHSPPAEGITSRPRPPRRTFLTMSTATSTQTPAAEKKVTHNEVIKTAIPTLAGQIAATVASGNDQFSDDDQQFIKFHGIYQQDDRDLRKTGKKFIMMVRGRIPGGVMTDRKSVV